MAEIIILGDICPRWGNAEQFDSNHEEQVFHDILPLLRQADFVTANMEAPLTDCSERLPKTSMNLKAKPEDAGVLKKAGIQALSLANNHILDFGTKGLQDTIETLDDCGILHYGVGSEEEAKQALFTEADGIKIGFLSFAEREFNCAADYGVGACLWDDMESIAAIAHTKQACDYLIVQYHGGIEQYAYPSPLLKKKCHAMITAGADFVTCQHSHCVGTREIYQGGEILYGQGNCIFGYAAGKEQWNTGLILQFYVREDSLEVRYIPIEAREDGEYLMEEKKAAAFLENFNRLSQQITDSDFLCEQWQAFCQKQKDDYLPLLLGWGRIANKLNRVARGKLTSLFFKQTAKRNVMNVIRCDAHREVITTILEKENGL